MYCCSSPFHSWEWSISNFPCSPPEILHHTVWRTWLFIAYSDERWLHYKFSLPHSYNCSSKGWENALFELRSERVKTAQLSYCAQPPQTSSADTKLMTWLTGHDEPADVMFPGLPTRLSTRPLEEFVLTSKVTSFTWPLSSERSFRGYWAELSLTRCRARANLPARIPSWWAFWLRLSRLSSSVVLEVGKSLLMAFAFRTSSSGFMARVSDAFLTGKESNSSSLVFDRQDISGITQA